MAVKIFFCYAHKDETLLAELKTHLTPLLREGLIEMWYDRDISAGMKWEQQIQEHLNTAQIILLLISPDFMASDYINNVELKKALERDKRGEACVIPVILRHTYWKIATLQNLQALPTDAKPVKSWSDQDEAFFNVAEGIRKVVEEFSIAQTSLKFQKIKEEKVEEGNVYEPINHLNQNDASFHYNKGIALSNLQQYEEAISAYEQPIRLNPNNASAYNQKGIALRNLERYQEAISAYEQAIRLNPNDASFHYNKGIALSNLQQYEEAISAYEQAIRLNPKHKSAFYNKGVALRHLQRYEEAVTAYEQAIHLNPNDASAYNGKSVALRNLGRYEEAIIACDKALRINPDFRGAYNNKGIALEMLGRSNEARQAYKKAQQLSPKD